MKKKEALKVVRKLGLEERRGKELFFKFSHNDKLILTTAIPKGQGDLYIEDKFRGQLKLTRAQLEGARKCPFKKKDYIKHLQEIGSI